MEEFDLFNKAVNEYNKLSKKDELCKEDCKEDCKHNNIRKEKKLYAVPNMFCEGFSFVFSQGVA